MSENQYITSDALNVTKFAGWGSFLAGVIAAAAAAMGEIQDKLPTEIQIGLLAIAGVALVVVAAVVITDMRARKELALADMEIKSKVQPTGLDVVKRDWNDLVAHLEEKN